MIFDLNVTLTSFIITQIDPLNQLRNVIDKFFTTYNYIHYIKVCLNYHNNQLNVFMAQSKTISMYISVLINI